jgi:hypothetical protein
MANMDAELIFCEGFDPDDMTADDDGVYVGASNVLEVGCVGPAVTPLLVKVMLTEPLTSGAIDEIALLSGEDDQMANAVEEMKVSAPASVSQTAGPATIAQFYLPIKLANKFIALEFRGATQPVGGAVTAFLGDAPRFHQ